ncbi:DUF2059 domain-containing protein [Roseovarius spongiae]|uniref:DUF2059 domain-containing protein n=1 Tax=Roseovarius spongiae TaxID=2320272 RepID=A0A3A8AX55_9RHOB|nr:DUF2059 domain-containing protein [Roseovarius spongiae]RKF17018.1 DUF2059 domain-containing protein [Roseovarius spongiae]
MIARVALLTAALWALCLPGFAQEDREAQLRRLYEALDMSGTIAIMDEEGDLYGAQIAEEMLPDADADAWAATVARIYSPERMQKLVEDEMAAALGQEDIAPILAFFEAELGERIVALELAARKAFLDPEVEEAAKARAEAAKARGDPVMDLVDTLIADSDLVELNVAGGLNSNLMFYRGLADGGALDLGEEDILRDVWAQEEESRADTQAWLRAFLLLAYDPLTLEELDAYAAFYRTDAGRALNAALFRSYNRMYDQLSYLLGQAVAQHVTSAPL